VEDTGEGQEVDSKDYIWTGGGLHEDPWGSVRYRSDGPGVREGIRKGPAEKVGVGLEVCEQLDWEAMRETALRKSPPGVSILHSRDDCISLCLRVEMGPRSMPSPLKVCSPDGFE
jgi:hypothetical protein